MKKRYGILLAILLFFIPVYGSKVVASNDSIKKFYMDATVEDNGDILVKEIFDLAGNYNGFERVIQYRNPDVAKFDGSEEAFNGSDIYNGTSIQLVQIKGIPLNDGIDANSWKQMGTVFLEDTYAQSGSYGTYTTQEDSLGARYKIFNPASRNQAFYLEYRLTNMAVLHNDVAELGWNIFSDALVEDIDQFELTLHLPGNQDLLRGWAHGPLNGTIKLLDQKTVKVTIDHLQAKSAMDVRLMFDRNTIINSTKKTDVNAKEMILKVEGKRAEEANQRRKQAQLLYYGIYAFSGIWMLGLGLVILYVYYKYDREYRSDFNQKYFREFPNTYGPEIVGYLMNKKIETNELSASILNLVYKKVVQVDEIPNKKKKDYQLTYQPEKVASAQLTTAEMQLISWLFGKEKQITLRTFQKKAKSGYESFLTSYDVWKKEAQTEANSYRFYEAEGSKKVIPILYSIVGFFIAFGVLSITENIILGFLMIILAVIAIIYLASFTRRTKFGNDEFQKWKAFKNFLLDFGHFSDKELPEIVLWEKYLVYAVSLGCASKLSKVMQVRIQEMPDYVAMGMYPNMYDIGFMMAFNRSINHSVNSAVSNAISTRAAAQSSSSSAGGFGGGFSGGGGSFGGGGGGGRF